MSAFQFQALLDEQDAQLKACADHIVEIVNKQLDLIQYTGVIEFDSIRSCGKATIYLDPKIARKPFHFCRKVDDNPNQKGLIPEDIFERLPRIVHISGGEGVYTYYVDIRHGDPKDWPVLKEPPVLPRKMRFERWLISKGLRW